MVDKVFYTFGIVFIFVCAWTVVPPDDMVTMFLAGMAHMSGAIALFIIWTWPKGK